MSKGMTIKEKESVNEKSSQQVLQLVKGPCLNWLWN